MCMTGPGLFMRGIGLHERQGTPAAGVLFSILSPKQALYNACNRLEFPAYSPIDFRKARITWFLRKGVAAEAIAKWQGHRDNGVLIRRTYAWVISDSDNAYEQEQLSKEERLDAMQNPANEEIRNALTALLQSLRACNVFVLSKGAIEDYYPADGITGRDKPSKAQCYRNVVTSKAQMISNCPIILHDSNQWPELELICNLIFSS